MPTKFVIKSRLPSDIKDMTLTSFSSDGFSTYQSLPMVVSKRPVIFTSKCQALGEGTNIHYLYKRLTTDVAISKEGIELTIIQLRCRPLTTASGAFDKRNSRMIERHFVKDKDFIYKFIN
jgi:hypothetical protein